MKHADLASKTIESISPENGGKYLSILFTDGTSLDIEPRAKDWNAIFRSDPYLYTTITPIKPKKQRSK